MLGITIGRARGRGRFLIMALAAALSLAGSARAGQATLTDSGGGALRRLTLENDFLKVVIDPSCGGQIVSLIYKPTGQEMTRPPADNARGGLLSDGVYEQDYWHSDWNRAEYSAEVIDKGPDKVEVKLTGHGTLWVGLTIAKTIRLRADRPVVEADYQMSPSARSEKNTKPDFCFHQTLGPAGRVFFPSPAGVVEGPGLNQVVTTDYEPTRGWAGYLTDKGVGMGATMDFARLRFFSAEHADQPTLEWVFRKMPMAPTSPKLSTPVRLAFFTGLDRIDAVGDKAAVAIDLGKPAGTQLPATVKVAALDDLSATLSLYVSTAAQFADSGQAKPSPVLERKVDLAAGKAASFDVPVPLPGQGTFVVWGIIAGGGPGGGDLRFERSVVVGQASGVYTMPDEAPAIPEVDDSPTKNRYKPVNLNFNSLGYNTPHRTWMKPSALGKLKVLALVKQWDARQAVELGERFDMDLTCPYITGPKETEYVLGDSYWQVRPEYMNANIDKALAGEYDVILTNNYSSFPILTEKQKKRVIEMLENGTGLVLMCRGDGPEELKNKLPFSKFLGYEHLQGGYSLGTGTDPMLHGLPLAALPRMVFGNGETLRDKKEDPNVQELLHSTGAVSLPMAASTVVGKGRLVQCVYAVPVIPSIGYQRDRAPFDYWEYQYAVLARMMYWAAHKESPVRVEAVNVARQKVEVKLVSADLTGPATVHLTLRDHAGTAIQEADLPVTLQAGQPASVELTPSTEAGKAVFLADVLVNDTRGTLAFGGGSLPAEALRIVSTTPDKTAYDITEEPKVTVKLSAEPPAGSKVVVTIWDGAGRLASRAEADAHKETAVGVKIARVIGPIFDAHAELLTPAGSVDMGICQALVRVPRPGGRFMTSYWGGGFGGMPPYLATLAAGRYFDMGMTANYGNDATDEEAFGRMNMPFRVSAGGMYMNQGATPDAVAKNPDIKGFCEPENLKSHFDAGVSSAKLGVDKYVIAYSLGDENRGPTVDMDFSKSAIAEFRKWLQEKQYKTIADLNNAWKTHYEKWDQVMPMSEAQAKKTGPEIGSYGGWVDQRSFNKDYYARQAAACADGVLSVDKNGPIGESGTRDPATYDGVDWWTTGRVYKNLFAYGGLQENEQMTYNPDMIRYQWSGYGKPNPFMRVSNWGVMGKNNQGVAIFAAGCCIDPDFTLSEPGRDLRLSFLEMRAGPGQLLTDAKMANDPVMVLQSPTSMELSELLGQRDLDSASRYGFVNLMDGLSLVYQPISYEQLADGHLAKANPKVLCLTHAVALSPQQAEAIAQWVQQGGTLIADLQPGILTEHGQIMPKGQLDELMGVDRSAGAIKANKWVLSPGGGWTGGHGSLLAGTVEVGVKATTSKALWAATSGSQTSPVVFYRKVGQGQTYYMAYDSYGSHTEMANHALERGNEAQAAAEMQFQADILASGSVRPRLAVTLKDEPQMGPNPICPELWVRPKAIGDTQLFLILRNYNATSAQKPNQHAVAHLAKGGYLYDVLAGRQLGQGDTLNFPIANCTIRLLAVLPYQVTGLDIGPATLSGKPGQDVTINAKLKVDGDAKVSRHVFHVDVSQPDGQLDRSYCSDVEAPQGQAAVTIPLALNDPAGAWRIHIHDVTTGASAEATLNVQASP